jgi:ankyrin repeat protein
MRRILFLTMVGLTLVPAVVRGGEIHDAAKRGGVAKVKQLLALNPELANAHDDGLATPLHVAAAEGFDELVLLLLARGARTDEKDWCGCTALHQAVLHDKRRTAGILLSKGANVNAFANQERTPLFYAACKGNVAVVELLLCHGADVHAESLGETPLKVAVKRNHTAVAEMLRRAGARE